MDIELYHYFFDDLCEDYIENLLVFSYILLYSDPVFIQHQNDKLSSRYANRIITLPEGIENIRRKNMQMEMKNIVCIWRGSFNNF